MGKFFKTAQEDKKPITATASVEAAKAVISDATRAKAKSSTPIKANTLQKIYKSEQPNTFIDTVMNKMSQLSKLENPGGQTATLYNAYAEDGGLNKTSATKLVKSLAWAEKNAPAVAKNLLKDNPELEARFLIHKAGKDIAKNLAEERAFLNSQKNELIESGQAGKKLLKKIEIALSQQGGNRDSNVVNLYKSQKQYNKLHGKQTATMVSMGDGFIKRLKNSLVTPMKDLKRDSNNRKAYIGAMN